MPKIILVANNLNNDDRLYQLGDIIAPDDLILRFNIGVMSHKDRTDIVMFRKTHTSYIGFTPQLRIRNKRLLDKGIKHIFIDENSELIKKIQSKNPGINQYTIYKSIPLKEKYGWNPSSGLIAIEWCREFYPNHEIYLFNFSWNGWRGHDFAKEKKLCMKWIKEKKIKILKKNQYKFLAKNNEPKYETSYETGKIEGNSVTITEVLEEAFALEEALEEAL